MQKMLFYRAALPKCAVDFRLLNLGMSVEEGIAVLRSKGYGVEQVDIIALARARLGIATYRAGCDPREAPDVVDCSSFIRWLYANLGVWLPRYAVQQYHFSFGTPKSKPQKGDLAFSEGLHGKYWNREKEKIGHVGICTEQGTIIHAANSKRGVVEDPLGMFLDGKNFQGIRRIFYDLRFVYTITPRPGRLIEVMDDIRWDIVNIFGRPHR